MKTTLFLFVLLYSLNGFSQKNNHYDQIHSEKTAYFLDSVFIATPIGINPDCIDSIRVGKSPVYIQGKQYENQIYIIYKKTSTLLSLSQIVEKYTEKDFTYSIFCINDHFLEGDISSVKMDVDYILKVNCISSDHFTPLSGGSMPQFNIVQIYTKTKENIKRFNPSVEDIRLKN